jgi:diguanylate cyclase (GGDEF)-like protein/PAS domain S-box-containing protein
MQDMISTAPPAPPARRRGLAYWIAIALAWAVLVAVVVLLFLVERFAERHATRTATAGLAQIGWQMRDQLDRGMAYRYEELRILSGLQDMQPGRGPEQRRAVLERVQQSFPLYAWIGYVHRDGRVEAATGGLLEGQEVSKRPWFQGGVQGAFVGDVHPALLLEKLLPPQQEPWRFVDVAMPVRDAEGGLHAVLGAHLSWEWARDLQRNLLAQAESAYQAQLFVVDAKRTVLLGPAGTEGKPLDLPAVGELRAAAGAAMRDWGDGQHYATAIVPTVGQDNYPGLGWVVVVRQAEQVAFADYHELQREMAIGGIAVCLLAALCAPLAARRLTRPLHRLTQAVGGRAAGRADPIPLQTAYREVELLSRALTDADAREARDRAELEQVNAGLEARIQERTAQISASQAQLHTITDNIPALVADVDRTLRYRFANRAYLDWFGKDPDELIGETMESLYGEAAVRLWQPELARVLQGERVQFERSMVVRGQRQHSTAIYLPYRNVQGQVDGFHALVFDTTASKELELRLENEATRDALTGLPNRRLLQRNLPAALARSERQGHSLALLFLDLNGFKAVNDTHGHEAGDELLRQVGQRLVAAVRVTDTVARLAGDEYVVLLEPVSDPLADPVAVAAKIDAAIAMPFVLETTTVQVSVSIGSAVYQPGCGTSADELLSGADSAMYAAKRSGKKPV